MPAELDRTALARFLELRRTVLKFCRSGLPKMELLRHVSEAMVRGSGSDVVEWWLREGRGFFHCEAVVDPLGALQWEVSHVDVVDPRKDILLGTQDFEAVMASFSDLVGDLRDERSAGPAASGPFYTGDVLEGVIYRAPAGEVRRQLRAADPRFPSFVLVPLPENGGYTGFVQLKSRRKNRFSAQDVDSCTVVAEILATALASRTIQAKLEERIKELGCLYAIVRLAEEPGASLDEILRRGVKLIPPAWQYPEITAARIEFDGEVFSTSAFRVTPWRQSADIIVAGRRRGRIDVSYLEQRPPLFEGPFLEEERSLIDAISREIAGIVERRHARETMERLETQLRHADRLATIGQLAAGVAHELNEPLGAMLGFAQLAKKAPGVSEAVEQDLEKIIEACLHSRKIVSKLRLFARQMPLEHSEFQLNELVEDGLSFVKSRCAKHGIRVVEHLDPGLTPIVADRGQLHQVLVNLAVNAVQAMPGGGVLTIRTRGEPEHVVLSVEDTGCGMTAAILDKIFLPFFTTKAVDQGTGLGLSVVHGIVTALGGTVDVDSEVGRGSKFEIHLPRATRPAPSDGSAS